jgi:hypothetical protein
MWRREKSLPLPGIEPQPTSPLPATKPTKLSRLFEFSAGIQYISYEKISLIILISTNKNCF